MGECIRNKFFDLPPPKILPNTNIQAPHVFLGDEAFPLLTNLLKPYRRADASTDVTKTNFNYRLSRARRLVENAFGILANRFRIYHTTIDLNVSTIEMVVTSCCIIHNLMLDENPIAENSNEFVNAENDDDLDSFVDIDQPDNDLEAIAIRNIFKDYVNGAGAVPWQNRML